MSRLDRLNPLLRLNLEVNNWMLSQVFLQEISMDMSQVIYSPRQELISLPTNQALITQMTMDLDPHQMKMSFSTGFKRKLRKKFLTKS